MKKTKQKHPELTENALALLRKMAKGALVHEHAMCGSRPSINAVRYDLWSQPNGPGGGMRIQELNRSITDAFMELIRCALIDEKAHGCAEVLRDILGPVYEITPRGRLVVEKLKA